MSVSDTQSEGDVVDISSEYVKSCNGWETNHLLRPFPGICFRACGKRKAFVEFILNDRPEPFVLLIKGVKQTRIGNNAVSWLDLRLSL